MQVTLACQSVQLHASQSASAPSKKKKTYSSIQQVNCEAKEDYLRYKIHNGRRCVSYMREVAAAESIAKLLHGVQKPCVCARRTSVAPKKERTETYLAPQLTACTRARPKTSAPTSIRMGRAKAYASVAIIRAMRFWPYWIMRVGG